MFPKQPILSGEPQLDITCGATSIKIGAETRNPFEGNVYAKNHFAEPECRLKANGTQKYAEIEIPHGKCGTTRRRSLNPNGLFIEQTVVFSFHPSVLTKVDRAFKVRCFYMEAAKTVDQEIAVSVLSTGLATNQFVMPVCQYSVHSESPTGPPVRFALVGMPVYHVWECDNTQSGDLFKMRVYNCYVDDGNDSRVQLLDEAGCQVDKFLLRSLEYDQSGMRATQEAHVFKFADRAQLFFQCQIELCVDIEGGCQNTPPQCGEQTTSNSTSGGETATTDETSQSTIASGSAASTTEAASVIDSAPAETTTNSVEPAEAAENASLPTIRKKRFYENELTMPADNIVYQTDVFTDFLEVAGQEDVSLTAVGESGRRSRVLVQLAASRSDINARLGRSDSCRPPREEEPNVNIETN
uniref:ZP domain-containing protein n=1 Tax=Plectus sambesii TaxID=2011161 RepID=A0A914VFU2_9BILA